MTHDDQKNGNVENVVNLAEARRRQRTVQKTANGRADGHPPRAGGSSGKMNGRGAVSGPTGLRKVLGYVQLLILLAAVAYMMQLCRGG